MKKIIPLCICVLFSLNCLAQYTVGLKAGYTHAQEDYGLTILPVDARRHIHSFNIYGMFYKQLSKTFSLGIEPGYIQRGAFCFPGWDTGGGLFVNDTKWFLHYIDVPIRLKAQLPIIKDKLWIHTKVGAGAACLVGKQASILSGESWSEREKITNVNFHQFDYSANGAIGFEFPFKSGRILIESDYVVSFRDATDLATSMNRNWNVDIGYLISF